MKKKTEAKRIPIRSISFIRSGETGILTNLLQWRHEVQCKPVSKAFAIIESPNEGSIKVNGFKAISILGPDQVAKIQSAISKPEVVSVDVSFEITGIRPDIRISLEHLLDSGDLAITKEETSLDS